MAGILTIRRGIEPEARLCDGVECRSTMPAGFGAEEGIMWYEVGAVSANLTCRTQTEVFSVAGLDSPLCPGQGHGFEIVWKPVRGE